MSRMMPEMVRATTSMVMSFHDTTLAWFQSYSSLPAQSAAVVPSAVHVAVCLGTRHALKQSWMANGLLNAIIPWATSSQPQVSTLVAAVPRMTETARSALMG